MNSGKVNHHTGGLEIENDFIDLLYKVNHHTGGLEN